jgi:27-O-demethylrifamycin SV methyltransferase
MRKKNFPDAPAPHYDRVTEAWKYILGTNLHYGFFAAADDSLETATARLNDYMAHVAQPGPEQTVLDVGCGTGAVALYLARRSGCRVTAISTSEVGLQQGRELIAKNGFAGRIVFHNRDGMDNGFADEAFDCVWIMESSHLMTRVDALIAESARVLKPGGVIVLCDLIFHRPLTLYEILQQAGAFDILRRVYGRANIRTPDFYLACLRNQALEVTFTADISDETAPTLSHWRHNARRFREPIERLVGPEYWQQLVESCDILESLRQKRIRGYAVFAARKPQTGL